MNPDTYKPKKYTALHDHIKARITRKPNRIIKRSFIESAMCNHNIVILLMGMLVFLGILGICIMPKQEMPQFTIRQGACVAVYPGATSDEVEERVAKPLENFIFGYKEAATRILPCPWKKNAPAGLPPGRLPPASPPLTAISSGQPFKQSAITCTNIYSTIY